MSVDDGKVPLIERQAIRVRDVTHRDVSAIADLNKDIVQNSVGATLDEPTDEKALKKAIKKLEKKPFPEIIYLIAELLDPALRVTGDGLLGYVLVVPYHLRGNRKCFKKTANIDVVLGRKENFNGDIVSQALRMLVETAVKVTKGRYKHYLTEFTFNPELAGHQERLSRFLELEFEQVGRLKGIVEKRDIVNEQTVFLDRLILQRTVDDIPSSNKE